MITAFQGTHVKLLFRADPDLLRSATCVRLYLNTIVCEIGMKALDMPAIYDVAETLRRQGSTEFEDTGGKTGIVVLSTSHASIHTWPQLGEAVSDVYSCRPFQDRVVASVAREIFHCSWWRSVDISSSLRSR